jgi:outer membrane protein assembly factor BamB
VLLPLVVAVLLLAACSNTPSPSEKVHRAVASKPRAPLTSPWPMAGHDPQRTGRSEYRGPASPTAKWRAATPAPVTTSPVIGRDGTIYVGCADGRLRAINPDGSKKWEFATHGAVRSTPAIGADGTLYFGSSDKNICAVNPDGTEKWSRMVMSHDPGDPIIAKDGTVYIDTNGDGWRAIAPDGRQRWRWEVGPSAIGRDGTLYSFDSVSNAAHDANGKLLWTRDLSARPTTTPATAEREIVHCDGSVAVDSSGTVRWRFPIGAWSATPAVAKDGTVYVGAVDGRFYAIGADGSMKWVVHSGGPFTTRVVDSQGIMRVGVVVGAPVTSSPAVGADGMVYLNCNDAKIREYTPGGTLKWEFATGSTPILSYDPTNYGSFAKSPAIGVDGTLYVGTMSGLLAIGDAR